MKLVVYYPDESFLKRAEEAWQRFVEQVQPPPVEVTDIYWAQAPQPPADALTEAEAVQDLPGDPHLILRLSAQFFGLTPSSQMVTLLHETIRMSLRLSRLDDRKNVLAELRDVIAGFGPRRRAIATPRDGVHVSEGRHLRRELVEDVRIEKYRRKILDGKGFHDR